MWRAEYQLTLFDERLSPLAVLPYERFDYAWSANKAEEALNVSVLTTFDRKLVKVGQFVLVECAPAPGQAMGPDAMFRIERPEDIKNDQGLRYTGLTGWPLLHILDGFLIAYPKGSAQADRQGRADDLVKNFVRDNVTAPTDLARSLVTPYGFRVAPNVGMAPMQKKEADWQNLLSTVMSVVKAAAEDEGNPTRLYVDVEYVADKVMEFRTWTQRRGRDRTASSASPIILRPGINIGQYKITRDHSKEINFVYVGGQGDGPLRPILKVQDAPRVGLYPGARREAFQEASSTKEPPKMIQAGRKRLRDGKPIRRINAPFIESRALWFGRGGLMPGDECTIDVESELWNVRIEGYKISKESNNERKIELRMEMEDE